MNEHEQNQPQQYEEQPKVRREMTRRQFLSYTLGGTGAFMMGLPLLWNLRFAVDPLLQKKQDSDFVKVIKVEEVTETPTDVTFKKHVVDGFYEHDPEFRAWISKDEAGNIFALSPVCKHLGCTVDWNSHSDYPNEYYCPCHGAHYTKDGKQLAVATAPLDEYAVEIRDGWVYLGGLTSNTRV